MNNSITANNIDHSADKAEALEWQKTDNSLLDRIKRITSISEILRIFGTCAVIASLSLFMLEGWADGNDINRYLKLLGQTGLLTIAGLVLTFVVKEFKGARLFFGLGLISAVANFTILGALIYSMFQWDGLLGHYPAAMTWEAGYTSQFWLICAGASVLLTVLAKFSFSIFSRKAAGQLTIAFLALNALLLIPVRGTLTVSILTLVALLAATQITKRLSQKNDTVFTPETKFAFATLFLPGLIIIARALSLYSVDELFMLTLCGLGYFALRSWAIRIHEVDTSDDSTALSLLELTQYCLGFVIAALLASLLPHSMENISLTVFSLASIGITADQIRQSRRQSVRTAMLSITAVLLVGSNTLLALLSPMLLVKFASFAICSMIFVFANYAHSQVNNSNGARLVGLIGTAATFLILVLKLVAWINLSSWMTIGLMGMLLIVIGSCYERFGLKLPSFKSDNAQATEVTLDGSELS